MGFLTGKTAIITGAGYATLSDGRCGSIGYGIATAYAKEGANLVITGRNVAKLEKAKEELEAAYGIKVLALQADISAGADNEATANMVVKNYRSLRQNRRSHQQRAGIRFRRHNSESYNRAVRPCNVFRSLRNLLLYEGVLSPP